MSKSILLLLILDIVVSAANAVYWQGNWAMGCDFKGNDLSNIPSWGEECGPICDKTAFCTHYAWSMSTGTGIW